MSLALPRCVRHVAAGWVRAVHVLYRAVCVSRWALRRRQQRASMP